MENPALKIVAEQPSPKPARLRQAIAVGYDIAA
jgi:hypothetical protein